MFEFWLNTGLDLTLTEFSELHDLAFQYLFVVTDSYVQLLLIKVEPIDLPFHYV